MSGQKPPECRVSLDGERPGLFAQQNRGDSEVLERPHFISPVLLFIGHFLFRADGLVNPSIEG